MIELKENVVRELRVTLPRDLFEEVERRIAAGDFPDETALVCETLSYYFERHRTEDWEEYVRREVAWSRRNGQD